MSGLKNENLKDHCCEPKPRQIVTISNKNKRLKNGYISGYLSTPLGDIPIVDTKLTWRDFSGSWKIRWGIGRANYTVQPGLYAVGNPDSKSPVFISANFKMSFDHLRRELTSIDSWILVLDTKGINVWCAAGKGTFGTDEIVRQVQSVGLPEIITHRQLILPQLGAPGVAAHDVKKRTGFNVVYGPVRAEDIPGFIENNRKATSQMRQVRFDLKDRISLIPVELVMSGRFALSIAICFLLLSGLGNGIYSFERVVYIGLINALIILIAFILGVALPIILLPILPGRAFALKGFWIGLLLALSVYLLFAGNHNLFKNSISLFAWFFIIPSAVSFLAMNFTGSSTYTSMSGVLKEMRYALPLQMGGVALGLILWLVGLFI